MLGVRPKEKTLIRDDISDKLIHLTRGNTDQAAADAFLSIMNGQRLLGGDGCIKGGYRCVCFSEAPLNKLAHILANPSAHGMRYSPFGVMVNKEWLFEKGGRPVIYQLDSEYSLLDESQRFRHVRYEPGTVDFTWEREWRVRVNELAIDPAASTLVVPNRAWEKWAFDQHMAKVGAKSVAMSGWASHPAPPWHFVVLEDLGVSVSCVSPPP